MTTHHRSKESLWTSDRKHSLAKKTTRSSSTSTVGKVISYRIIILHCRSKSVPRFNPLTRNRRNLLRLCTKIYILLQWLINLAKPQIWMTVCSKATPRITFWEDHFVFQACPGNKASCSRSGRKTFLLIATRWLVPLLPCTSVSRLCRITMSRFLKRLSFLTTRKVGNRDSLAFTKSWTKALHT